MANKFYSIVFTFLSVYFVASAIQSLQWRMVHDAPIMLYVAFLIEHFHYVPYRDLFDMNMPGTYIINILIGRFFGYSDLGFRCIDLIYLAAILTATWFWMRKLGRKVAWSGTVLFGLSYLGYGPAMSMQREYLIILPIILALLVSSSFSRLNDVIKCSVVGFFFGIVATIKPHAAIAFPLLLIFQVLDIKERNNGKSLGVTRLFQIILSSVFGFMIPITAIFIYLLSVDAWTSFFDIVRNYWPLYTGLTSTHKTIFGLDRILYVVKGYRSLGGMSLWLAPSVIGVYVSLFHSNITSAQKRQIFLLIGLVLCYSIYPAFAGQFWSYHWLPYLFFILLLSSVCFVEQSGVKSRIQKLFPVGVMLLVIVLSIHPPLDIFKQPMGDSSRKSPKGGRVDEIASYLKANMEPEDRVQPLDWAVGGAVHAMLIAKARLATPFVYTFHFYHHISNTYIQHLRKRFIDSLRKSKPRFIVQINAGRPWITSVDTTGEFRELQQLLSSDYIVVSEGDGYVIYENR